ncbi:bifunctional phosphoglucose/phosphomannose isomerase [Aliifodinibius sp. S!AR15-10]|uniref:bifunctional phosphoglucose/phosphomannose isomerase n=1 Tax=Aliifodinibius sp. S!AR15-10 TaxID=2950437 RepID=UPI0028652D92|nr:bifunctional phosphoglucose/phosphomannose isomerase [Aliifodinibius sp. S!AR15-10]MDR8394059.1 bifunctional phosphoglucose/phosphomannose isomerase [Aliifodinibius sp. S!AR15-10]
MMELTKSMIEECDTQQMWDLLVDFPNRWDEAVRRTVDLEIDFIPNKIKHICIAGMGGSAIAGDLIQAYTKDSSPVPVEVVKGYEVPNWVDEETLMIASSFSGNTEETLAALQQAREKGAKPMALTSGGELLLQATRHGFDYFLIPSEMRARAAVGYSFIVLFRIFQKLGFLKEGEEALAETKTFLENRVGLLSNYSDNEALGLANELSETLPVVYTNNNFMKAVGQRWCTQFEENSKTLSYRNEFPEMTHTEIVGWEQITHLTGRLSIIFLMDREDGERIEQRMRITRELIEDQADSIITLNTSGKSRLTRMFSLIQLADWTSFYLAIINGVDPSPVAKIDLFKSKLAEQ